MIKKKLNKSQKEALILIGFTAVTMGLGIYMGYSLGQTERKVFESLIETVKETNKIVTTNFKGVQIFLVPEGISIQ